MRAAVPVSGKFFFDGVPDNVPLTVAPPGGFSARNPPGLHNQGLLMSAAPCVVFFDIDGTLLNTGGAGQRAMELALTEEFDIRFPFEGVLTAGRTDRGIADEIFERYGLTDTQVERDRFRNSYLRRLPGCLHQLQGALLPGIPDLLQALAGQENLVLSLLTGNYSEGAWIKLRHFGIDQFFREGGFGDEHPDRDDVARQAAQRIRLWLDLPHDPPRMMVIGDTPADVRCARAIGARAVAVATGHYSVDELSAHQPDILFTDFGDHGSALSQLVLHIVGAAVDTASG